jgi:hypothetical protein
MTQPPFTLKIGGFGYYPDMLTFHISLASCWQTSHRKWQSKLVKCWKRRLEKMVKKSIKAVNWRQLSEGERVIEGDMAITNEFYMLLVLLQHSRYYLSLIINVIWGCDMGKFMVFIFKKSSYLKSLFLFATKKH